MPKQGNSVHKAQAMNPSVIQERDLVPLNSIDIDVDNNCSELSLWKRQHLINANDKILQAVYQKSFIFLFDGEVIHPPEFFHILNY